MAIPSFSAWRGVVCCAAFAAGAGCITLVDRDTKQCRKDSDCEKGGAFEGLVCTKDKVCGRETCEVHSDCAEHYGRGAYCRPDATCGNLYANPSCLEVLPKDVVVPEEEGRLKDEDIWLVGFMAPLIGNTYGEPLKQGAELAMKEINNFAAQPRKFAMLVCHEGDVADEAPPVANHLVHELQVQAILGPGYSGATRAVAGPNGVTQTAGVLTLSASATNPDFEQWADGGLFWRTVPSDSVQAPAVALVTKAIRDKLTEELAPPGVTLVWRDNSWGRGMQAVVDARLRDAQITPEYELYSEAEQQWDAVAATIAAGQPRIIVGLGNDEFPALINAIEAVGLDPQPYYVLPESVRLPDLQLAVQSQPSLAARILGTAPGGRQSQDYLAFKGRFQGTFGQQVQPGNLAEFAYDAAYLLSFAALRTGQRDPTGLQLTQALAQMSCKDAGTKPISASSYVLSVQRVATEACLDFSGASGEVDFNDNGETWSDMQIWCPRWDAAFDEVDLDRADEGLYYDVDTQQIQGELVFCPAP